MTYHINPETHKMSKCRAFLRPCRFGKENHYNTQEEVEQALQKTLTKNNTTFQTLTKTSAKKEYIKLMDVYDVESYAEEISRNINNTRLDNNTKIAIETNKMNEFINDLGIISDKRGFVHEIMKQYDEKLFHNVSDLSIDRLEKIGFFDAASYEKLSNNYDSGYVLNDEIILPVSRILADDWLSKKHKQDNPYDERNVTFIDDEIIHGGSGPSYKEMVREYNNDSNTKIRIYDDYSSLMKISQQLENEDGTINISRGDDCVEYKIYMKVDNSDPNNRKIIRKNVLDIVDKQKFLDKVFKNTLVDVSSVDSEMLSRLNDVGFFESSNYSYHNNGWIMKPNVKRKAINVLLNI